MSASNANHARQEQAALALATGATIGKAALKAGVSEKTIRRWRADSPEFLDRIGELRRELTERTLGRLVGTQVKAVGTLRRLLACKDARVQLGAAKAVLEMSWKAREHDELAAEVAELKELIEQSRSPGPKPARRA